MTSPLPRLVPDGDPSQAPGPVLPAPIVRLGDVRGPERLTARSPALAPGPPVDAREAFPVGWLRRPLVLAGVLRRVRCRESLGDQGLQLTRDFSYPRSIADFCGSAMCG